jgi:multidrug efflux system outer membrane protein
MASGILLTPRDRSRRCWISNTLILFLALPFLSCAHSHPREAELGITLPETYTIYAETAPVPDRWWEAFASEELDRLIRESMEENRDLKVSYARLQQSRAQAVLAGMDKLPDLELRAGASETRRGDSGGTVTERSRSLTLVSSWELDFWGELRAGHRAAILDVEASREELYASALTLSSEVTLKWLETIAVNRQLALYRDQLETNRTILDLMEQRYLKGLANALDIYQQRQAVAENEAGFPQLEARLENLKNELAVLVGKPPGTDLGITAEDFPDLNPPPDVGLPADLLSKRPDIRAAGLKLRSSENQVEAARAGRLPGINLSATAGYSSDSLDDLLDNWLTTLAANLTWPLFNSGIKKAEVTRRQRIVDERLASYEQIVLQAIREVQDALVSEQKQSEYIAGLEKQLAITRDGFREAVSRYRKGLSDYLPVLSALTSTQRLERTIVQAQLERFSQRVMLYRALGGGWMAQEFDESIIPEPESRNKSLESRK